MKHLTNHSRHSMEQELQKAKELLTKSEHIAILMPERPDLDCYTAAEALVRAYEQQSKHIGFLPSITADAQKAPDACVKILNPSPLVREFIISIETAAVPIAQLRYEKHPDRIDIILSPKSSPIREDSFSFREGKIQCDCVIALGVPDIDALPALAGVEPPFFTETPIIAISNTPDHKSYGEINLVSPASTPLSQITYALITETSGIKPDAASATLLLTGIIAHTDGFRKSTQGATHTVAAELLGLGAEHARATELTKINQPFTLHQLTARAAVRSKQSDGERVLWSFLTAEDFRKTGRSPSDIPHVSSALTRAFPIHQISILLWQDPEIQRVHASILGDRSLLNAITEREQGTFQSPTLALETHFESFNDAEEHLVSLLREIF
ncbi:MAG: hypothetical protein WAP52_03345 [Candidatus Sungiibacteriota bacterium]